MRAIYAPSLARICARCIAEGKLGQALGDPDYALHDITLLGADAALAEEVLQRTPGIACFNPFDWPVLDGKPLAFLGYGDEPSLSDQPDVRAAVAREFAVHGVEAEASPYALIFKEIDGSRYRVVLDPD